MPERPTTASASWKAQPAVDGYDEVRGRIVDATAELIRSDSVSTLRLEAVAERAGLARSSVYRYFGSKEELVMAAVVQSTLEIGSEIQARLGRDAEPEDFVVRGIIEALAALAADPLIQALTAPGGSKSMSGLANDALREGVGPLLEPMFTAAARRGELREGVSVDHAVRWLQVVALGLMQVPSVVSGPSDLEDLLRTMLVPALIDTTAT